MKRRRTTAARATPAGEASTQARRWLLFVHQLPSNPSNLRVRTWRRLQQLGALPIKQAVYALPDTPAAREDFEWLKTDVESAGGQASVFSAGTIDAWSDDALVDQFRRARQDAYAALAEDVEKVLERDARKSGRARGGRAPALRRLLEILRQRLSAIEGVDFFGSPGRERVTTLLKRLEDRAAPLPVRMPAPDAVRAAHPGHYQGRRWFTRPRPGVDRMASAWLIRRFIDPRAQFAFATDRDEVPGRGVPFDMFGVAFSHQGGGCTFETLCTVFGIDDPAAARIAAIVHDLDLKDGRFGAPECATVGAVIDGLQLAHADDDTLLAQGMTLFESLYQSFEQSARSAAPRAPVRGRTPATKKAARRS
jgi:hypothetical protein